MAIMIDASELDSRVVGGARLIGLLKKTDSQSLTLDESWFEDPPKKIGQIPQHPEKLLDLVADVLDPASAEISSNGNSWHPISVDGKATGLYVVLPTESTADPALLGAGLWGQLGGDDAQITPSVHLPLFALGANKDPRFVLGEKETPLEVAITIQSEKSFKVASKSFNTLSVAVGIFFDGTGPDVNVSVSDNGGQRSVVTGDLQALQKDSAGDWKDTVNEWIDRILKADSVKARLNKEIGSSKQTPGTVLVDLGILEKDVDNGYKIADLSTFLDQDPLDYVQKLIFEGLSILAEQEKPLIPVGEHGIYVVERGDTKQYGMRVCLPDIALTKTSDGDNGKKQPQLALQIGKWFTGEKEYEDSWLKRAQKDPQGSGAPGITVYLVKESNDAIEFKPRLELVSVGLDFVGGEKSSLVSVRGFELGGIEPRLYIALDLDDLDSLVHGYGVRLDRLAVPLGTQFDKLSGDNPVAANLLASGRDDGDRSAEGDEDAANPTFSISGGYVDDLSVQLYGQDDEQTDTVWFPVQRAYGPLSCKRIGVGWHDAGQILSFLFDGSVSVDVLTIDLIGLSVGIPVTRPTELSAYTLGLNGLALEVSAGPVEISGGLVETTKGETVSYQGRALIKTETFAIDAFGAYTTVKDEPSLFIFALANYPLGGPPCFFVMGLAAGFGYNRSLKIPSIEQVQEFPLLAAMNDLAAIGGEDASPGERLEKLGDWIPPAPGAYWLAAGVSFTSFKIVNSNVLAVVEFGKEFAISIMGLSTVKLPHDGHTYAYAELMIQIVVKPAEGVISAMALLSPNSFVFDPACHLTGGFAFCVWFGSNPHAGDFVLTIGGYHPSFPVPDWYPQVPRLGFNWAVSKTVTIKGEAYFALTPSCVMVGGALEVLYHSGNLKAWFTAHADVIVYWKPFYFEASIGVSIGVSYRLKIWFVHTTLKVELGASVELWGPPTGGKARISWCIISFTVSFGAAKDTGARTVNWDGFKTMLPQRDNADAAAQRALAAGDASAEPVPNDSDLAVIQININDGLLRQEDLGHGKKRWIIRPDEFAFSFESAIPATEICLEGSSGEEKSDIPCIGIRPMGIASITSIVGVCIQKEGKDEPLPFDEWDREIHTRNLPKAMWGQPGGSDLEAESPLVEGCPVGVKAIRRKPHKAPSGPPKFESEKAFTYFPIDFPDGGDGHPEYPLSATATEPTTELPTSNDSLAIVRKTLVDSTVRKERTAVFEALAGLGADVQTNDDLSVLAANPASGFQACPMLGTPVSSNAGEEAP